MNITSKLLHLSGIISIVRLLLCLTTKVTSRGILDFVLIALLSLCAYHVFSRGRALILFRSVSHVSVLSTHRGRYTTPDKEEFKRN